MSDTERSTKTYNQIQNEMQRKINSIIKKEKPIIEQKISALVSKVKNEISGYLKVIVNNAFISVFTENYGGYFNPENILNSIECGVDDNLSPIISYKEQQIDFDKSFLSNIREFNINSEGTRFKKILDSEEFNALEQDGAFLYGDDPLSMVLDEQTKKHIEERNIFNPHNKIYQQGAYSSISNTYARAKTKAIEDFYNEYIHTIRPAINKKYGLDIK